MAVEQAYYSKGFQKSIADTHSWRNVENSAKFVLDVLKPNFKCLDVGCGPGSITVDFANYLPEGSIIGVEPTPELIDTANQYKLKYIETTGKKLDNVSFQDGSIYKLPFEDNTFDLVHAHQVVLHLQDPTSALIELRRVTKPGGFVCVKDADIDACLSAPKEYSRLGEYYKIKGRAAVSTDIFAGRNLRAKALKAGYETSKIKTSSSHWFVADNMEHKKLWSKAVIARIESGGERLYPDDEKKEEETKLEVINLWNKWKDDESSVLFLPSFEITYQK
ncbi:uncharacterized protein J8A68_005391 [[Candida] subhashii]|uniref:Methyltransferase domain-containing protein n=1 Tax=[Candida] subhashii TaxID=561895 RepID=A0A8J5UT40_9ASCO|nr:uncharacterized protein J8A68_005391 [[Candida] subhashii]KAG7661100.1 hypothetical protein J8A68_005391 [[Candida] subhashii]